MALKDLIWAHARKAYCSDLRSKVHHDNLGRRIALANPDTGKTDSQFDLAGNLIDKVTANLRAEGKAIRYSYDYLRLSNVTYPNFPGNDIRYQYGAPRAPFNRAGRIVQVQDQGGREEPGITTQG